jgi:hypothetical protein
MPLIARRDEANGSTRIIAELAGAHRLAIPALEA